MWFKILFINKKKKKKMCWKIYDLLKISQKDETIIGNSSK